MHIWGLETVYVASIYIFFVHLFVYLHAYFVLHICKHVQMHAPLYIMQSSHRLSQNHPNDKSRKF